MAERPEWFAPKRYGLGAGLPIAWQGWLVTAAFVVAAILTVNNLRERPLLLVAILVPLTIAFGLVTWWTTRGGWRWRWGEDE